MINNYGLANARVEDAFFWLQLNRSCSLHCAQLPYWRFQVSNLNLYKTYNYCSCDNPPEIIAHMVSPNCVDQDTYLAFCHAHNNNCPMHTVNDTKAAKKCKLQRWMATKFWLADAKGSGTANAGQSEEEPNSSETSSSAAGEPIPSVRQLRLAKPSCKAPVPKFVDRYVAKEKGRQIIISNSDASNDGLTPLATVPHEDQVKQHDSLDSPKCKHTSQSQTLLCTWPQQSSWLDSMSKLHSAILISKCLSLLWNAAQASHWRIISALFPVWDKLYAVVQLKHTAGTSDSKNASLKWDDIFRDEAK